MTELILVLVATILLLAVVPQLLAYLVGLLAQRRGSWLPVLAAVLVAPLVYLFFARWLYEPGAGGWLQAAKLGERFFEVEVHSVELGAAIHAGVALLLQLARLFRSD